MPVPLRDYFLIGDCLTAALVSSGGSIDWLCLPAFDAPSVFGALLDEGKGGSFRVRAEGAVSRSAYLPESAIVETVFEEKGAAYAVRDFMVPAGVQRRCHGEVRVCRDRRATNHDTGMACTSVRYLVRNIVGICGESSVAFTFSPAPDYGRMVPHFQQRGSGLFSFSLGSGVLWFSCSKNTKVVQREGQVEGEIFVRGGENVSLILAYSEGGEPLWDRDFEGETLSFWREWVAHGSYPREHRDLLVRSAITLKLLQYAPTGAFVAAPSTSLPEEMGGVRNWDYRYTWVRDGAFTAGALAKLGYREEAQRFLSFLEERVPDVWECGDLRVMYTIHGDLLRGEEELQHLAGYGDSRPVRIGNGAAAQRQLDIYGSLLDLYAQLHAQGVSPSARGRDLVHLCARRIAENWQKPESGIWEVRGGAFPFTYGKVMCWVGVDRALRMADALGIAEEQKRQWQALREEMRAWIWDKCFDAARGTFRQHPGTAAQDATNFFFILLGFLEPSDPRAATVIAETRKELSAGDAFVYRYRTEDGLPGGEGAFLLCSFWMIAALAKSGCREEARELLRKVESTLPPSGLMAEEIDTVTGMYLGNFPQAFSHLGYIIAAMAVGK